MLLFTPKHSCSKTRESVQNDERSAFHVRRLYIFDKSRCQPGYPLARLNFVAEAVMVEFQLGMECHMLFIVVTDDAVSSEVGNDWYVSVDVKK